MENKTQLLVPGGLLNVKKSHLSPQPSDEHHGVQIISLQSLHKYGGLHTIRSLNNKHIPDVLHKFLKIYSALLMLSKDYYKNFMSFYQVEHSIQK